MSEQHFFTDALSDFTFEMSSGGAIRHLTNLGYTVKQISEKLTYQTPYERVKKTVWQQLLDTETVLLQEPGSGRKSGRAEYAVEHDRYGKTSFRLVSAGQKSGETVCFKERRYDVYKDGRLAAYLASLCEKNGEKEAYASCGFGILKRKDPEKFEETMAALQERQREYVAELPWENAVCYHLLNGRMQEIIVRLYEAGLYEGTCYFLGTGERVCL